MEITMTLDSTAWGELGNIFSAKENLPEPSNFASKNFLTSTTTPYIFPIKIHHDEEKYEFEITIIIEDSAPVELVTRLHKLLFPEVYSAPAQSEPAQPE